MADDRTDTFILGALVAAITGIYGFFVKHLIGHADKSEIEKLWEQKQSVGRCDEIVKRMDENHMETCKKLDKILEKLT